MGYNKRVLSKAVSELGKAKAPAKPKDIITDPAGQWKYPGQETRIPGSSITMQGVNYPVWAQPNIGPGTMMQPNQDYEFPGADYVDETPMAKKGGTLQSKKYSKSMSATNKLFAKNKLFKNKKSKIFDPNAEFKKGGSKLGPINLNPNPLSHYELNYGYNLPTEQDGGVRGNPWLYTYNQESEDRAPGQVIGLGADFQHKSGLHGSTNVELPFFNKNAIGNLYSELGYNKRFKNFDADATLKNYTEPGSKFNPSFTTGIGYNKNLGDHFGFGAGVNNTMVPGKLFNPGIQAGITYRFQEGGENEDEYMDLTDEEIQAYRDAGYEVDELPEAQEGGPKDTIIYPPGDSEYMNQPALNYDILEMQNQKARRNYEQYLKNSTDPTNIQRASPSFQQKYFMNKDVVNAKTGGYVQHELVKAQTGLTKKPLLISDPKEFAFRNKMYADSLSLYNQSQKLYNQFKFPKITEEKFNEIRKKDDNTPNYFFDQGQYNADKKNKIKKSFDDYIVTTTNSKINDHPTYIKNNPYLAKYSDDIEKFSITLKNGTIKTPSTVFNNKPDFSDYNIYDPSTGTSYLYATDYLTNKPELLHVYNHKIQPIRTDYFGSDTPVLDESIDVSEESKTNNKITNQLNKKYKNYYYDTDRSDVYKKPTEPVKLVPKSNKSTKIVDWRGNEIPAEYLKIRPPIYVSNPKDSRIGRFSEAGNIYVYRPKPAAKVNVPKAKVESNKVDTLPLKPIERFVSPEQTIIPSRPYVKPKQYSGPRFGTLAGDENLDLPDGATQQEIEAARRQRHADEFTRKTLEYQAKQRAKKPIAKAQTGLETEPQIAEEDKYATTVMDEVVVKGEKADWAKLQEQYEKNTPYEEYFHKRKQKYLKNRPKNLTKLMGIGNDDVPESVANSIYNDYQYRKNNYVTKNLGPKKGFNPRKHGEWVDNLSNKERVIISNSRYGKNLQPSLWARTGAGAQELANFLVKSSGIPALMGDPDKDVLNYKTSGLTNKEWNEIHNSGTGGLETFSGLDVFGAAVANKLKNSKREQPGLFSGQLMGNVSPGDAAGLNPFLYTGIGEMMAGKSLLGLGADALRPGLKTASGLVKGSAKVLNKAEGKLAKFIPERTAANSTKDTDKLVDLYRIQEKGARPMAELAAEGKLGKMGNYPAAIKHFKDREKYFGQWFTKDKSDFDFYKADREFKNPEIIHLKVPKSKLEEFQNYDKSLSRASDREFVIPHDKQSQYINASSNAGNLNAGISPELIQNFVGPKNKILAKALDKTYLPWLNKAANKINPLNFVPGYGNKLEGAVRPLGNTIGDVIEGKNLITPKSTFSKIKNKIKPTATNEAGKTITETSPIQFTGPPQRGSNEVISSLRDLRTSGKNWDKIGLSSNDLLRDDMLQYHGTFDGRPVVEVKMPDGTSQHFYKSTGAAGKSAKNAATTEGMWQPFGGYAQNKNTKNWFIKDGTELTYDGVKYKPKTVTIDGKSKTLTAYDQLADPAYNHTGRPLNGYDLVDQGKASVDKHGYESYYGSKTFQDMAENMDQALMRKTGTKSNEELNNAFNFNNRYGNVDSYTPGQKIAPNTTTRVVKPEVTKPITTKFGKTNASDIYSAHFDPDVAGSGIKFGEANKQGVIGRTFRKSHAEYPIQNKAGENLDQVPLNDPGVKIKRRLPLVNKYVDVNKQKLMNNEFQWATTGAGLQRLGEKFGTAAGLGVAGGLGTAGAAAYNYNPLDYYSAADRKYLETKNTPLDELRPNTTRSDVFLKELGKNLISPIDYIKKSADPYMLTTIGNEIYGDKESDEYKQGGIIEEVWEDELDEHTIALLRKAGYTVEELD